MELKQGYKQTEVGLIPEDWECYIMDNICSLTNKKYSPIVNAKSYRCVELEHISSGTGRLLGYVNSKNQLSIKNIFENDDILFGKLRPYLRKFFYATFNGVCSTEIWVIRANSKFLIPKYLYYIIQSRPITELCSLTIGTKMPRMEWSVMRSCKFAIPPLPEQKTIAFALSDVDELILSLEKLIAKKKNIKLGAMQELLTGKKRLPGFNGEWQHQNITQVLMSNEGMKIGPFGSQLKKEYLLEQGQYKVYGQENVYNSTFSLE